jgi:hypothetical protein
MKYSSLFFPLALLTTALACNQNEKNNAPPSPPQSTVRQDRSTAPSAAEADAFQPAEEQSESPRDAAFSTAVARDNFPDSTKRFVRTADIRFLTKDVLKATLAIEDITLRHRGFVTQNHLEQVVQRQWNTPTSADSMLETTVFEVSNKLTLRVPWQQMDTTLRLIGQWCERLEYRHVDARDISLEQLANELEQLRNQDFAAQVSDDIAQHGKNLGSIGATREQSLRSRALADAARIENLTLADAVRFSTIHVSIRQRQTVQATMLPREKTPMAYSPGIWTRVGEAIKGGWQSLVTLFVTLLYAWPYLLVLFFAYIFYRRVAKLPTLKD